MSKLKVEGKSIPNIIIKHLGELLAISKVVLELCIKCEKVKQHLTHRTTTTIRLSVGSDKQEKEFKVIQELIDRVKNAKVDYLYYQRVIYQQRYEALVKNLLAIVQQICYNPKHEFYKSRKFQIQIIGLVVTAFDEIQRKVKKYLQELSIQYPAQLTNYLESTIKLVKNIKVQKETKAPNGLKINFHFQAQPDKNYVQQIQPISESRPEKFKFSQIFTTATTRPSSTGKSNREGSKMLKIPQNTQPASIHQNYPIKDERNSHMIERVIQSKVTKIERCKTAKILRANKISQKQTHNENRKNRKSSLDVQEESRDFNGQNSNQSSKRESRSRKEEKINSLVSSQGKMSASKTGFFEQVVRQKNKNKSRIARIQNSTTLWGRINAKKSQQNTMVALPKSVKHQKHPKISQTFTFKQDLKVSTKRNYQSDQHQISFQQKKLIQPTKNSSYKKKAHTNRRRRSIKKVGQTPQIPEEVPCQDKKPVILLIKPPGQSVKQEKSSKKLSIKQLQKPNLIKNTTNQIILKQRVRKNNRNFDISFSQQIQKQNLQTHHFKIQLEEINNLRSQFVKARWQNKIIGSQNQQNSVFFIEQGFLSQRQNMRFQAHLLKMKENYGKQYHKEPFNLDCEIEQTNNRKLKELERQYTFQIENDWIKQKYHMPESIGEFNQLGLEPTRQFAI